MNSIYEIFMALPLFHGVSRQRILQVVESTRFHFLKFADGESIVTAGEECSHVKFVISGSVRVIIANSDSRFRVGQTLEAPDVIFPDFLFGRDTHYPCSATAIGDTGVLQISKAEYVKILSCDEIFLYNLLNHLSMNAQKSIDGVLALTTGSLERRIAFWIMALTQPSGKDILLECRQRDLYSLFGVQRTSFMATLESMKQRGLIDYTSTRISITSRRLLLEMLQQPE
ncbi:MAG: Crp/Fnr family transcriptional regulator [Paramuribaculum sp.]|nr:Crp/Fnr family transcriptional regulator [Paramuribaculum sp.]